jgi:hypothetical protein
MLWTRGLQAFLFHLAQAVSGMDDLLDRMLAIDLLQDAVDHDWIGSAIDINTGLIMRSVWSNESSSAIWRRIR